MEIKRYVPVRFAWGWGVWDNARSRFSDGIYSAKEAARDVAESMNDDMTHGNDWGDRDWFGIDEHHSRRTVFSGSVYYGLSERQRKHRRVLQ